MSTIEKKRKTSVLVLVSDPNDQEIIARYLREFDAGFIIAADKIAALAALNENEFTLILISTELADADSFALAGHLRFEQGLSASIVAITRSSLEEVKYKCFIAGMNACIQYPIDKIALDGILTQFLQIGSPGEVTPAVDHQFAVLDLSKLHELSLGDKAYELDMTEKFINHLNADLVLLDRYLSERNHPSFKQTAHHFLSTIYVMGLEAKLGADVQYLLQAEMDWDEAKLKLAHIHRICDLAKLEALNFLWNLKASAS
ncbi:hypothetical protein [Pedobacter sp.]|uniref:hypothetical protein n=1 Tax=Pedobacter sp. TaxID=1411316 RepID=UPI003BA84F40